MCVCTRVLMCMCVSVGVFRCGWVGVCGAVRCVGVPLGGAVWVYYSMCVGK